MPVPIIGDFNKKYCDLIQREAPVLRPGPAMLKSATGAESTSMLFDAAAMFRVPIAPRRFAHELGKGSDRRANYVAATFARWGPAYIRNPDPIDFELKEFGIWAESGKPNKRTPLPGLVIGIDTPPVLNEGDFGQQIDAIRHGIEKSQQLRQWILDQQPLLQRWKQLLDSKD